MHTTASIAQLAEHALRKRTVVGSIPTGGFLAMPGTDRTLRRLILEVGRDPVHATRYGRQ
jgi:hypothetical protein